METWNSLEISKLAVQAALPLVLAFIGYSIKSEMSRRENLEWRSRIDVEWRLRVFDSISVDLNKLECAFTYVGDWKTLTPQKIVGLKRDLDRTIRVHEFLWSDQFIEAYNDLMNACFETNRGKNIGPAIRANIQRYKLACGEEWQSSWEYMFVVEESRLRRTEFLSLYQKTMDALIVDIGMKNS